MLWLEGAMASYRRSFFLNVEDLVDNRSQIGTRKKNQRSVPKGFVRARAAGILFFCYLHLSFYNNVQQTPDGITKQTPTASAINKTNKDYIERKCWCLTSCVYTTTTGASILDWLRRKKKKSKYVFFLLLLIRNI